MTRLTVNVFTQHVHSTHVLMPWELGKGSEMRFRTRVYRSLSGRWSASVKDTEGEGISVSSVNLFSTKKQAREWVEETRRGLLSEDGDGSDY